MRRVVCAAIRVADGDVLLGIRHYSMDMHWQIGKRTDGEKFVMRHADDQGFVDQHGVYMTRKEAMKVAMAAGQVMTRLVDELVLMTSPSEADVRTCTSYGPLRARVQELATEHGSLRKAAIALGIDVAYLSRLQNGQKWMPSDAVLEVLGMRRHITFTRELT